MTTRMIKNILTNPLINPKNPLSSILSPDDVVAHDPSDSEAGTLSDPPLTMMMS